ncbi:MAG: hypothetical protein H0U73_10175 [Tatlockia sp.]|nr:hypothetical protein [Tatlockia sp.]
MESVSEEFKKDYVDLRQEFATSSREDLIKNNAVKEMIESEKRYNAQLSFLNKALDSNDIPSLLTQFREPIAKLFELSNRLLKNLSQAINLELLPREREILKGHRILLVIDFFEVITNYCPQYKVYSLTNSLIFEKLDAFLRTNPNGLGGLRDHLILPVQRATRYALLVQEIQKQGVALNEANLRECKEVLAKIQNALDLVNSILDEPKKVQKQVSTLSSWWAHYRIGHPFREIYHNESDDHIHAHTLRSTLKQKFIDTFYVFAGSKSNPKHFGLFDILILPFLVEKFGAWCKRTLPQTSGLGKALFLPLLILAVFLAVISQAIRYSLAALFTVAVSPIVGFIHLGSWYASRDLQDKINKLSIFNKNKNATDPVNQNIMGRLLASRDLGLDNITVEYQKTDISKFEIISFDPLHTYDELEQKINNEGLIFTQDSIVYIKKSGGDGEQLYFRFKKAEMTDEQRGSFLTLKELLNNNQSIPLDDLKQLIQPLLQPKLNIRGGSGRVIASAYINESNQAGLNAMVELNIGRLAVNSEFMKDYSNTGFFTNTKQPESVITNDNKLDFTSI